MGSAGQSQLHHLPQHPQPLSWPPRPSWPCGGRLLRRLKETQKPPPASDLLAGKARRRGCASTLLQMAYAGGEARQRGGEGGGLVTGAAVAVFRGWQRRALHGCECTPLCSCTDSLHAAEWGCTHAAPVRWMSIADTDSDWMCEHAGTWEGGRSDWAWARAACACAAVSVVVVSRRVLCCAVVCCAVLWCAVLCCAVLCCAVLCCAVLCCAVLC